MSYVDTHLNAGERVVFRTSLHPIVFAGAVIAALLATVFVAQTETRALGAYFFLLAMLVAGYTGVRYVTSEFAVTTSRVIIKVGWLSQRTIELQLSKVEGVVVEQGLVGRRLDYGSIVVGGTGGSKELFGFIRAPIAFRKQVQEQIEATKPAQGTTQAAGSAGVGSVAREERECPHCAERILVRANRCRFCGQAVQALA